MSRARTSGSRLGVYVDDVYHLVETEGDARISTDRAFLLFVCEVGRHFERLVLFGRSVENDRPADYVLPSGIDLAPLPHYSSLADLRAVLRAAMGTVRGMWRGLDRVDTVWVFGPHPFALLLVALAALRRRRIVLGVRQDTLAYHRARLPGRLFAPLLLGVRAMDWAYRALSRVAPTTVVGRDIARHYSRGRTSPLTMTVTLVRAGDIATPFERDWTRTIRILTVARMEPEKNPALLIEVLARLQRDHPGRYHLTWLGRGALEPEVRRMAQDLHVADNLDIRGYVPFGPALLRLYGESHIFVHVSLTEGVPQVLIEAHAMATPIVATDVGGVRGALDDGRAGMLVPPDDLDSLVRAIVRLYDDESLRDGLVARGLELVREKTLEREAARVARYLVT